MNPGACYHIYRLRLIACLASRPSISTKNIPTPFDTLSAVARHDFSRLSCTRLPPYGHIYGVRFLSVHTPSRRDSLRTPTYLPCSIRARVASDMIVGQVRGSLLTLTIVNLSWHAMEVSIQDPPWPYGEASQPRLWEAKPSSLAACGSRASHCNERQMLGGSSSKDPEA